MNKDITLEELLKKMSCDFSLVGNTKERYISNVKSIMEADRYSLSFVAKERKDKFELINNSKAGVIICDKEVVEKITDISNACYIVVSEPRSAFAKLVNFIFKSNTVFGIHPTAVIHEDAQVHPNTYIGANTYIGQCEVGEGTVIYGNSYLYDNVKIGKNVIINANCSIGAAGFGYLKDDNGVSYNFPHIGSVVIGDDVEIGSNTCIDRGALGATNIKSGAKIDNLVHIAHNVSVGHNAWIIANSMIGGSTIIEDNAYIAPSSCIRDGVMIGKNTTIGMGAVVTKNVPASETWTGSPAKELSQFLAQQKKLKEL